MEFMKKAINGIVFLTVPVLIFLLMESYEHNPFSEIRPEAFGFNILLFELLAWILFTVFGNGRRALRVLGAVSMVFGITNHYVMKFRSTPFVPWDFYSILTAASVAGNYDFTPDTRMVVVTLLFLVLIASSVSVFVYSGVYDKGERDGGYLCNESCIHTD